LKRRESHRPRAALSFLLGSLVLAALVWPIPALAEVHPSPTSPEAIELDGGVIIHLAKPTRDEDMIRSLELEIGKAAILRTAFQVKRVSVGNPKILDVVVLSPREIQLVPSTIGETNLVLWDPAGAPQAAIDIHVGAAFTQIERQLRKLLGTDEIHVDSAGEAVVLSGSVASPAQVERAIAIAQAFFPEDPESKVVNALEVGGNQQVMIEVIFAEMTKTLGRRFAVNWDTIIRTGAKTFAFSSFLDGLTSLDNDADSNALLLTDRVNLVGAFANSDSFAFSAFIDVAKQKGLAKVLARPAFSAFIDVAKQKGLAKVLARPTLIARSGQHASFLVGGEIPVPIAQGGAFGSITIEWKSFGVGMDFSPVVLGEDRIFLEISPEVSEPDLTLGIVRSGVLTPGFVTRRSSTAIELGDGQSFAIAGLLRDSVKESVEKFPLLGDIPVLGALFRSSQYRREETELVMIVTPHLVKPLPPGPQPLPTDSFVEPNDFEFYLLGALEAQSQNHDGDASGTASGALIGPAGHRVPLAMERSER
jgi:pilus assembly protein CpaC